MTELILASKSPRRQELLKSMGFDFKIVTRETDESFPASSTPEQAVAHIALNKARALDDLSDSHVIISADTIVVLDGDILGKPSDEAEAIRMLEALSGRSHDVMTACCISHRGQIEAILKITRVHFRVLSQSEIAHYVQTFQPYDKAGSYGIQEWIGTVGITGIEGSYHNVVGLPTAAVYDALQRFPLNHP